MEEELDDKPAEKHIFKGMTAWFSSSVGSSYKATWREYGGIVVCCPDVAKYCFGSDTNADDIVRIYDSLSFISLGTTVFKPSWIESAIETRQTNQKVGSFILPPNLSKTKQVFHGGITKNRSPRFDKALKSYQQFMYGLNAEDCIESYSGVMKDDVVDMFHWSRPETLEAHPENCKEKPLKPSKDGVKRRKRKLYRQGPLRPPKTKRKSTKIVSHEPTTECQVENTEVDLQMEEDQDDAIVDNAQNLQQSDDNSAAPKKTSCQLM